MARRFGLSEPTIGPTVVAMGTSSPEFAVSLGNAVGSNVYNVTGILGLGAAVRPLATSGTRVETLAWSAVVSAVLVAALWSGRVPSRPEGALFTCSEVARGVLGLVG